MKTTMGLMGFKFFSHGPRRLELSKRVTQPGPPWVGHLVSQPNPTHLLVSQNNSNPARPTMGWWVKWVGSLVHLIKKNTIFFYSPKELYYSSNNLNLNKLHYIQNNVQLQIQTKITKIKILSNIKSFLLLIQL